MKRDDEVETKLEAIKREVWFSAEMQAGFMSALRWVLGLEDPPKSNCQRMINRRLRK